MKLNIITKICLFTSLLLLAGVFIVNAAGFVSFEDGDKMVFWDNVKIIKHGLKMSSLGINDLEVVDNGNIKFEDNDLDEHDEHKDLYIKRFIGFNCENYPISSDCETKLGDLGTGGFLEISQFKSVSDLHFIAPYNGMVFQGDDIKLTGKVVIMDNHNLIVASATPPSDSNAVFVDNLVVKRIYGKNNNDLKFSPLIFQNGAVAQPLPVLQPLSVIHLNVTYSVDDN